MSGPINNAKEKSLLVKQDWFQHLVEIGGVVVFVGLLIEDGPELWEAIWVHHRLPSRGVIGGTIVAIGVGVEVLFASLVTHVSKQLQEVADARNAELHERAATAETRTAELQSDIEASRERQKQAEHLIGILRLGEVPRHSIFDSRKLAGFLMDSSTKGTAEVLYQPGDGEASALANDIHLGLIVGGWTADAPKPMPSAAKEYEAPILALRAKPEGITILARSIAEAGNNPVRAAFSALVPQIAFSWEIDPELPEGLLRIVVGPKP